MSINKRTQLALAASCLLHSMSLNADTDKTLDRFISLSLEELVSLETTIATATKHTTSKAPAVVTLITEDDIKATGATNLVDILEGVPGIHVRANQFAFRPLVQFRGASANQTLVMINGMSMKDLMWGFGIFWKGIPASIIDRIEIIRGPGSALFGADASAGVVNVITKTAGRIQHSEAGIRAGSFNSQTAWLQHGSHWNGFELGITAEISSTDGHDPFIASDGQLNAGNAQYGWDNQDIRFSIARNHWRLHADYTKHTDLETGLTGAGNLDPLTQASDSRYNLDLFYNNENYTRNWGLNAELRHLHLKYSSGDGFQEFPPGTDLNGIYPDGIINQMRSAERRWESEVSGTYKGFDNHTIRLGAGHTWQDLYSVEQYVNSDSIVAGITLPPGGPLVNLTDTPYAFAPEKTRRINHVFLQDIWQIHDLWELTMGFRYDNYSDFGNTLNPRLALVWQSTPKLTTKFIYGEAFRAPSYQELFAETSFSLPNPDLDPEKSKTAEISFSYAASKQLQLGLSIYNFEQIDLIRRVAVSGLTKSQYQNTECHTIQGIEMEAQWQASESIRLSGNYTSRRQDNNNLKAYDEPEQEAYLRADWSFMPNWNWNLQGNWIGERKRKSTDIRLPVDDYLVTDTTLRFAHSDELEFAISIRNLFDEDAREYTGGSVLNDLPLPERNTYAEMRIKF